MNFKNSKFYKRIQELRHFSKEKVRRDREREYHSQALLGVQMALSEAPHHKEVHINWPQHILPKQSSPRRKKKEKVKILQKKAQEINRTEFGNDGQVNGYIELNKLRYRVPCSGLPEVPVNNELSKLQ